jgi:hypothetical protein
MKNKELLQKKILWQKHSSNERFFFHYENENLILLRINNFPDEPLYTLINGLEILDFDDAPNQWIIPL